MCFFWGLLRGETPCFVYRGKAEDLDPVNIFFWYIIFGIVVNRREVVMQMGFFFFFFF